MPVELENCMITSYTLGAASPARSIRALGIQRASLRTTKAQNGLIIAITPGAFVWEVEFNLRRHPGAAHFALGDGSVRGLDEIAIKLRDLKEAVQIQTFGDPNLLLPAVLQRTAAYGAPVRVADPNPAVPGANGPVALITSLNACDGSVRPADLKGIIAILIGL